jgi:hypothetical protein
MTQAQAITLANSLNDTLKTVGADIIVEYTIFPYWDATYVKYYNVILYPNTYAAKMETATDSQKLAFARVSIRAQTSAPSSYENFIVMFDAEKVLDTELNQYLKK